jgi:hypothetical protein
VEHFVGGRVKGFQPHATGRRRAEWHHNWSPVRTFLSEEGLKSGQDEMALKRKSTKTRAEREFLKLPEANFFSSITVRDGITTLSA